MARIAYGPMSNTNSRTPRIPAVAIAAQMARRAGHGNATANHVTTHASVSHASHTSAPRREGTRSIRLEELLAEGRAAGIGWDISREQIARDVRIGQFQKLGKGGAFVAWRLAVPLTQVTQQQEVEFPHATPALPGEAAKFNVGVQSSSF